MGQGLHHVQYAQAYRDDLTHRVHDVTRIVRIQIRIIGDAGLLVGAHLITGAVHRLPDRVAIEHVTVRVTVSSGKLRHRKFIQWVHGLEDEGGEDYHWVSSSRAAGYTADTSIDKIY